MSNRPADQPHDAKPLTGDAGAVNDRGHRLDGLIETLPHGVVEYTADGRITSSNAAHHALLGYPEGQLLGKPIWATLADERSAADMRDYLDYLVRVQPVLSSYTSRHRTRDGRLVDLQVDAKYERDAAGAVTGFVAVMTDVTERERALRALRESHMREREIRRRLTALHDLGIRLSQSRGADELCRLAVDQGRAALGFDRLSIWLGRRPQQFGRGTYGIDEHGNVRDERDRFTDLSGNSPVQQILSREMPTVVQPDTDLFNDVGQVVGRGALAAAALWDGEEVIGALMTDNLLSRAPLDEPQVELLRLYASTLGHLITRQRAEAALHERAEFENLIARISTSFINLPAGAIDDGIYSALRAIGEFCEADRCFILRLEGGGTHATFTHQWRGDGAANTVERDEALDLTRYRWLRGRVRSGEQLDIADIETLPEYAVAEKQLWRRAGVQSLVAVPMISAEGLYGYVGHASVRGKRIWRREIVSLLTIVGQMLANALDRQRVELALQESERRYRGLVETQQDLIVRVDPSGRLTFVNDAYCAKFGRSRGELLGRRSAPFAAADDPDDAGRTLMALGQSPQRVRYEQQTATADGLSWIAWEHYAIRSAGGEIIEIQAVGRDITDLKRAEEEARRHLEELAHAARLNTMGEMATSLAHELNQPLSAISNYLGAALRRMKRGETGDEVLSDLHFALTQTRRAGQFVRRIKDFIRKKEPRRSAVNLTAIVDESLELLADLAESHRVVLRQTTPRDLPAVRADRIQTQQVLINLVRNAIEALAHAPDNAERAVDVIVTARPEHVETVVRDEGPGVSPEDFERLFEPFHTTKPDGTGLGLSISRSIIQANGGHLRVQRTEPHGLTFAFTLPRVDRPEEPTP